MKYECKCCRILLIDDTKLAACRRAYPTHPSMSIYLHKRKILAALGLLAFILIFMTHGNFRALGVNTWNEWTYQAGDESIELDSSLLMSAIVTSQRRLSMINQEQQPRRTIYKLNKEWFAQNCLVGFKFSSMKLETLQAYLDSFRSSDKDECR
jgi:hypothetical protein